MIGSISNTLEKICNYFRLEKNDLKKAAEELVKSYDLMERIPVRFDGKKQEVPFEEFLRKGEGVVCAFPAAQLKRRLIALRYRLERTNGGTDPGAVDPHLVSLLREEAIKWKKSHEAIDEERVSGEELLQIQEASRYPEFVELLFENEAIKEEFMRWTLRDGNNAPLFIEFPATQQRLCECNLNGRIGRLNPDHLQIVKEDIKTVTLLFEGKPVSILDESRKVTFKGNWTLTVAEAFQIFKDKYVRAGDLEYMACGIINWNVQVWGFWNADEKRHELIDLSHSQWWHQLPLFELIGKEEANARYNTKLDGNSWCVAATATRSRRNLDYMGTHAFFEIAIPWGDGRYAIFDFGKYSIKFPSSFFESLSMFCHNAHATVAYPDENVFYTHRQRSFHPFPITEEEGKKLMERIKGDMIKSQEKNFVYQIESENCAKWVHENLAAVVGEEHLPNMFYMHLLDTHPTGVVEKIFGLIKLLPKSLQTPVLAFCHLPMGAAKQTWIVEEGKYVCKSVTRHHFWETGMIFLPAFLIDQKERGHLDSFFSKRWTSFKELALRLEARFVRFGAGIIKRLCENRERGRIQKLLLEGSVAVIPSGPQRTLISTD